MDISGPQIQLQSGKYFSLVAPKITDVQIEDIAHGLSNICRFTGHVRRFYSVAEHCVHASYIVPEELALEALLHDAQEAYLGDVSSPLKSLLCEYRVIEDRVEELIRKRFTLQSDMSQEVRNADMIMLATERHQLLPTPGDWTIIKQIKPIDKKLPCWEPNEAERQFLARYYELTGE